MRLKKLPAEIFDEVALSTRLSDKGVAIARSVLVDGRSVVAASREFDVAKQWVYKCSRTMETAYFGSAFFKHGLDAGEAPEIEFSLTVPGSLGNSIVQFAEAYARCPDAESRRSAAAQASHALFQATSDLEDQ